MQKARGMEECGVFGELQGIQYGWNLQYEGAKGIGQVLRLGRLGRGWSDHEDLIIIVKVEVSPKTMEDGH